jgi:hypothetical protein
VNTPFFEQQQQLQNQQNNQNINPAYTSSISGANNPTGPNNSIRDIMTLLRRLAEPFYHVSLYMCK